MRKVTNNIEEMQLTGSGTEQRKEIAEQGFGLVGENAGGQGC